MDLIESFESLSYTDIEEFVTRQQEEHLHLDFKRNASPDLSHSDDKKTLAKAISGFANAAGGLLVWGVDARQTKKDGPDCARELIPITDLSLFLSRLSALDGDATDPAVEGIRHRRLEISPNVGLLVTFVPASDSGPHQAKFKEDRYYKRNGSQFLKMEHFDIEDMFGRRRRPKLEITGRPIRAGTGNSPEPHRDVRIILGISNVGRGSASSIFLGVAKTDRYRVNFPAGTRFGFREFESVDDPEWHHLIAISDFALHPAVAVNVAIVEQRLIDRLPVPSLTVRYRMAAENCRLQEGVFEMSAEDVARVVGR